MSNADDEVEALKHFFWQAYPEIARPHQCLPSHQWIRDHLPSELREEYWAHALECNAIIKSTTEWATKRQAETGEVWDVSPSLPELRPELTELVLALVKGFETHKVKELIAAHGIRIHIPRCPRCKRILRTPNSQQCFQCGYDWHGEKGANNGNSHGRPKADQASPGE